MSDIGQNLKSYLAATWRTVRRFARAPFQNIPPAFGDTVPPELRVFEAEADEMQHHAVGEVGVPTPHGHNPSKPRH